MREDLLRSIDLGINGPGVERTSSQTAHLSRSCVQDLVAFSQCKKLCGRALSRLSE